jgi:hypothetical protein
LLCYYLLRQKESTKEKGDFLAIAPQPKNSPTLLRIALIDCMALVLVLAALL